MDTLSLTQLTPKFNPVPKDRLFYDRFEYNIGFQLAEVSCLRDLDHASIDDNVQRRVKWREIARERWGKKGSNLPLMLGERDWKDITETTVEDLHALAEMLLTAPAEFKLVVSINQAHVYTNDLILINRLDRMPQLRHKTYGQAVVSRPKNTIQLKNPRHQLRSYFRLVNLTVQQRDQLAAFLENQKAHVRLSPALKEWSALPFTRLQDYFFVDHDTTTWLTMLNLVVPGVTRKTMHIIPAK
jgi:hypothetical protein